MNQNIVKMTDLPFQAFQQLALLWKTSDTKETAGNWISQTEWLPTEVFAKIQSLAVSLLGILPFSSQCSWILFGIIHVLHIFLELQVISADGTCHSKGSLLVSITSLWTITWSCLWTAFPKGNGITGWCEYERWPRTCPNSMCEGKASFFTSTAAQQGWCEVFDCTHRILYCSCLFNILMICRSIFSCAECFLLVGQSLNWKPK